MILNKVNGLKRRVSTFIKEFPVKAKRCYLYYGNPEKTHKYLYKQKFGKELDLNNPKNLNEKIQYLICHKYGKKEAILSDKYLVKDYVESLHIENLYTPKTLKVYENAKDIDLSELPDKFALKFNHRSGAVFVCTDKSKFDIDGIRGFLNKLLKENYAMEHCEYHYKYIKRLIMAEEYLSDGTGKMPSDYKFYVIGGKCDRVLVCSDRAEGVKKDTFDSSWNHLEDTPEKMRSVNPPKKPENFEEMVSVAEKLCYKDGKLELPFARVDLYCIDGKIYFGEYTFTPAQGMIESCNDKALLEMGNKLDLDLYK